MLCGTGAAALPLRLPRLAIASFALGGAASYFIMQSTAPPADVGLTTGAESVATFAIEQYSTANLTGLDGSGLAYLLDSDADVIAVQGLTPDWAAALSKELGECFPAQYLFPDIGVTGLGLFSRTALGAVDSILIDEVVQVRACYTGPGAIGEVELFAVQTLPPLSRESSLGLEAQLNGLSAELERETRPTIVVGDLNAVPWSPAINRFTAQTGLLDSRRSQLPSYEAGMPGLFESPVEHIFYTERLRCVRFETLRTPSAAYLGNRASFQSAPAAADVVAL